MSLTPDIWPEGLRIRPARCDDAPCIVILHGLGAANDDFSGVADFIDPQSQWRWVFPNAPERPVTLNGGRRMRAWFDIFGLDARSPEDAAGLAAMATRIMALLDHEAAQGAPVILGGFSQGGAMSLYTAFHAGYQSAAVLALSAYLPLRQQLPKVQQAAPIFWGHGRSDSILPLAYMEIAQEIMEPLGYTLSTHIYPMDHQICEAELVDLRQFLQVILA